MKQKLYAMGAAICIAIQLIACAADPSGEADTQQADSGGAIASHGRFVEYDITPEQLAGCNDILDVYTEGDSIEVLASDIRDKKQRLVWCYSQDGGSTWLQRDTDWVAQYTNQLQTDGNGNFTGKLERITEARLGPGAYFAAIVYTMDFTTGEATYTSLLAQANGNVVELQLEGLGNGDMPTVLQPLQSGLVLAKTQPLAFDSFNDGASLQGGVYNASTGSLVYSIGNWNGTGYLTDGSNLFLPTLDGDMQILVADTGDISALQPPHASLLDASVGGLPGTWNNQLFAISAEKNVCYSAGQAGVLFAPLGEQATQLFAADKYVLGSAVANLCAIRQLPGDDLLMAYTIDGRRCSVLRYTFDADAAVSSDTTLQVFSMTYSNSVQQAISVFCRRNPEINVEYEYHYTGEADRTQPDARTSDDLTRDMLLNMLNGTGPDVLVLDGLPWQRYIEQGALEPLENEIDMAALRSNVITPLLVENSLYAVPARFTIPVVYCDTQYVASTQSLGAFVQEAEKTTATSSQALIRLDKREDVLDMLLQTSAQALYGQNGLDAGALKELLGAADSVSRHLGLTPANAFDSHTMYTENASGILFQYSNSVEAYKEKRAGMGYMELASFTLPMRNASGIAQTSTETLVVPMAGLTQGAYSPIILAGVSSTSSLKPLAISFLQALLSEDVQNYDLGDGLPVLDSAFIYQNEEYEDYVSVYTRYVKMDMQQLASEVTTPVLRDAYLDEVITRHALDYLERNTTLDEAVALIQEETTLYFAERG